jgi:peptidoglycan/LPS O-acetylase OafA/YrhL
VPGVADPVAAPVAAGPPGPGVGGRVPSLDGLRAVAIGLVVLAHLGGSHRFPLSYSTANRFVPGELGVRVFFVLSGFLITGLLLTEQGRTGRISLARFYFRRTLRIFPAYYVFVVAMVLAAFAGLETLQPGDLVAALSYTMNFHSDPSWALGHAWSLGVEEQFYLLWPFVLAWTGGRRGVYVAAGIVIAMPIIRLVAFYVAAPAVMHPGYNSPFLAYTDALAIGCFLAGARERLWGFRLYRRIMTSRMFIAVPALVFGISGVVSHPRFNDLVGLSLLNVGIALTIDYCIRNGDGWVGRILNARPVAALGVLSYSLYLWQEPFIDRGTERWWTTFPINVGLALTAAILSHVLIERPFLALRERAEKRLRAANA